MGAETKSESLGETPPEAVLDKSEHSEYPPKKAVIPALIAGYWSSSLWLWCGLVSQRGRNYKLTLFPGSNHHWNGNPINK